MKIQIIPCLQDNYSYLIIDEKKNDACVVDPSEARPIINFKNLLIIKSYHCAHSVTRLKLFKDYCCKLIFI